MSPYAYLDNLAFYKRKSKLSHCQHSISLLVLLIIDPTLVFTIDSMKFEMRNPFFYMFLIMFTRVCMRDRCNDQSGVFFLLSPSSDGRVIRMYLSIGPRLTVGVKLACTQLFHLLPSFIVSNLTRSNTVN